jgi:hypothetical protein
MSEPNKSIPAGFVQYLSVEQVSLILGCSTNTVARQFESIEGVIDIGTPGSPHKRRQRRLRIPRQALERYIAEHQVNRRRHH